MLFATVYSTTVAQFPKAIFTTAAAVILVAIVFTCMLRPEAYLTSNKSKPYYYYHPHEQIAKRKSWIVDSEGGSTSGEGSRVEVERGRSRVSKALNGAGTISRQGSGTSGTSGSPLVPHQGSVHSVMVGPSVQAGLGVTIEGQTIEFSEHQTLLG